MLLSFTTFLKARARRAALTCCFAIAFLADHSIAIAQSRNAEPGVLSKTKWAKLAPLPDREGFAGIFAGVVDDSLVVAGGANFPQKKPWEGGAKIWSDTIFVLDRPEAEWRIAGKLPRPLGYGASITIPAGLICIGGSDSERHYSDVFLIGRKGGELSIETLPSLPKPCANFCAALLGQTIFVAGGIERPDSRAALKTFWSLDLRHLETGWQELEPWPGPGRMFAVAAAHKGSFYLLSGAGLKPDKDNQFVRDWLKDAYRYTPSAGWKELPGLPWPTVAAPSPSPIFDGKVLVLGGDDGSQVNSPPTEHRGFSRNLLAFDPEANRWEPREDLPFAMVTTIVVTWGGRLIIPGGEIRPGIRSTEVWSFRKN